jgi:3-hydroxyacyl-[acyl-carrier-protein] dehydratase
MLRYDFFDFTEVSEEGNLFKTDIKLNTDHAIFKGHFPGQPVLPGVCMVQMVKEVVESMVNKKTRLLSAADLKFLSIIQPEEGKLIQMELKMTPDAENIKVDARLTDGAAALFKFKGIFAPKLS